MNGLAALMPIRAHGPSITRSRPPLPGGLRPGQTHQGNITTVTDDAVGDDENRPRAHDDHRYPVVDVARVSDHLSTLDHFGANDVMLERISRALAEGRPLTDGQANFMRHETTEAALMSEGRSYEDAHETALQTHPPGHNYDPDVIDQFEEFGPWWRRMNGLEPR